MSTFGEELAFSIPEWVLLDAGDVRLPITIS
jgi:hypothetical protein